MRAGLGTSPLIMVKVTTWYWSRYWILRLILDGQGICKLGVVHILRNQPRGEGVSKCLRLITGGGFGRWLRNQNFHFLPIFVIPIGQFSLIFIFTNFGKNKANNDQGSMNRGEKWFSEKLWKILTGKIFGPIHSRYVPPVSTAPASELVLQRGGLASKIAFQGGNL